MWDQIEYLTNVLHKERNSKQSYTHKRSILNKNYKTRRSSCVNCGRRGNTWSLRTKKIRKSLGRSLLPMKTLFNSWRRWHIEELNFLYICANPILKLWIFLTYYLLSDLFTKKWNLKHGIKPLLLQQQQLKSYIQTGDKHFWKKR